MAPSNIEIVRAGQEHFEATGEPSMHLFAPEFVWDMSKFRGWPEQQLYEGAEGTQRFMDAWLAAWEEWQLEVESYHEAGEKVVAIMRQRGRARSTGIEIEMYFAMVWTLEGGLLTRMEMYAEPEEGLAAAGLAAATDLERG